MQDKLLCLTLAWGMAVYFQVCGFASWSQLREIGMIIFISQLQDLRSKRRCGLPRLTDRKGRVGPRSRSVDTKPFV